jgi:hypothetical protein
MSLIRSLKMPWPLDRGHGFFMDCPKLDYVRSFNSVLNDL